MKEIKEQDKDQEKEMERVKEDKIEEIKEKKVEEKRRYVFCEEKAKRHLGTLVVSYIFKTTSIVPS
jgi:hypothetical protein